MKLFLSLSFIIYTLFFTGCSSYSITKYFDKDEFYLKAIQETKKTDILLNSEVKVILTATYLNRVDEKFDNNTHNFIVSIYNSNQKNEPTKDINLTLNEKNFKEISYIEQGNSLLESIPLKNSWATYYFVKFEKEKDVEELKLTLKNQEFLEASLSF